ncbi:hypothetical protein CKF54_07010 [Psittacicella hinzii]|uniref:Pectate lyase superfamily protein n=1 Tax=Psittacicella hinzii TaxID=2028575 RepID=A0A3A1XZ80_9GAMM|nr:glycosyl hydrolase family 28 protein [Psittacicella hinzii]RIY31293.1 hypothetical protein CKF54_07010 [Psittacicella hinzii]
MKKLALALTAVGLATSSFAQMPSQVCQTLSAGNGDQTAQIQQALEACAGGKGAVVLSSGTYKVSQLSVPAASYLYLGKGTTLQQEVAMPSNPPSNSQSNPPSQAEQTKAPPAPMNAPMSLIVVKGDNVTLAGEGTISGSFVEPAGLPPKGKDKDKDLSKEQEKALKAQEKAQEVKEKQQEKAQKSPHLDRGVLQLPALVKAEKVANLQVSGLTFTNYHGNALSLSQVENAKVSGIKVNAKAPMTNGVVLDGVTGANLEKSYLLTSGMQVVVAAQQAPTTGVTLNDNYVYSGTGVVVGLNATKGISQVKVNNLVVNEATNGVAVLANAQNGGKISQVSFNNVYAYQTSTPIHIAANFNQTYNNTGDNIPTFTGINVSNFYSLGGGSVDLAGYSSSNKLAVDFNNVRVAKVNDWKLYNASINNLGNSSTGSLSSAAVNEVKDIIESKLVAFPR